MFKTHLNPSVFFKVKIPTIQQWSTNKLKYHAIFFDNCSADLQRTVVLFSLQDTEYIWFKQSNTVEIQKQNRKKNMKSWTSLIKNSLAFCKTPKNAAAEDEESYFDVKFDHPLSTCCFRRLHIKGEILHPCLHTGHLLDQSLKASGCSLPAFAGKAHCQY